MRSWLLLLVALSAATAETDSLPPALVHLVRNSISSVEDLKLLLQQHTNSTEEDRPEPITNRTRGRFSRSLVDAQPAQQAVCKVRTEVLEVTRSMLDRRNANFLLWPPCVEVQRCSGCCNSRLLQCVPTVMASRLLQVIKIQFVHRKTHYEKAIISVEDHMSCRCQLSPVSAPLTPPLTKPLLPAPQKPHTSRSELHRHDDLKHNQHQFLEDLKPRLWQQVPHTHSLHWGQPWDKPSMGGLGSVGSWASEARAEQRIMGGKQQGGHGSGYDGTHYLPQSVRYSPVPDRLQLRSQYLLSAPLAGSPGHLPHTISPPHLSSHVQRDYTEQRPTETEAMQEKGDIVQSAEDLRGGPGQATHPTVTTRDRPSLEQDRRYQLLEMIYPSQKAASAAISTALSTAAPVSSTMRQTSMQPATPRRRRNHQKRIGKMAIRAMIV